MDMLSWARRLGQQVAVFAAVLSGTSAAFAAGCYPIGQLPNYDPTEPNLRAYNVYEFPTKTGDDAVPVVVRGHYCDWHFDIKDGVTPLSDLEIQTNYRGQFEKLGAKILYQDDHATTAELAKNGKDLWIYLTSGETNVSAVVVEKADFVQTLLSPSGKDYRLLGHMPHFQASDPEKRNYDKLSFPVQQGDDTNEIEVKGEKYIVGYSLEDGAPTPSDLDIQTNYRNALRTLGAEIVQTDDHATTARIDLGGKLIWMRVTSGEVSVSIGVIEEKPFQASIKPPEESALKAALDKDGHVALYVNFDFAKATLKPDAAPVIDQVVKLLKDNSALKLEIDGHTDNIGGTDANQKLSEARAAAVVAAIASKGIPADRMTSAGFGASKPIADNATDDGRAKNRRVELVKP